MKYYKVPQHLDGAQVYNGRGAYTSLVGGELLTAKECSRIGLNRAVCKPVDVSRKKIYFFFGVRFENDF